MARLASEHVKSSRSSVCMLYSTWRLKLFHIGCCEGETLWFECSAMPCTQDDSENWSNLRSPLKIINDIQSGLPRTLAKSQHCASYNQHFVGQSPAPPRGYRSAHSCPQPAQLVEPRATTHCGSHFEAKKRSKTVNQTMEYSNNDDARVGICNWMKLIIAGLCAMIAEASHGVAVESLL